MSSGLPDFHRGVDVALQSLSEMTNRPKYGAAEAEDSSVTVSGLVETSLVSVTGKGIIYGGTIGVLGTIGSHGNIPILSIDGNALSVASFSTLNVYKMYAERCYPFYLMRYDEVDYDFAVGIMPGFTFEASFEVLYDENNNTTPTVSTRVLYALI